MKPKIIFQTLESRWFNSWPNLIPCDPVYQRFVPRSWTSPFPPINHLNFLLFWLISVHFSGKNKENSLASNPKQWKHQLYNWPPHFSPRGFFPCFLVPPFLYEKKTFPQPVRWALHHRHQDRARLQNYFEPRGGTSSRGIGWKWDGIFPAHSLRKLRGEHLFFFGWCGKKKTYQHLWGIYFLMGWIFEKVGFWRLGGYLFLLDWGSNCFWVGGVLLLGFCSVGWRGTIFSLLQYGASVFPASATRETHETLTLGWMVFQFLFPYLGGSRTFRNTENGSSWWLNFTNPFEKYAHQAWSSPQGSGWKFQKYLKPTPKKVWLADSHGFSPWYAWWFKNSAVAIHFWKCLNNYLHYDELFSSTKCRHRTLHLFVYSKNSKNNTQRTHQQTLEDKTTKSKPKPLKVVQVQLFWHRSSRELDHIPNLSPKMLRHHRDQHCQSQKRESCWWFLGGLVEVSVVFGPISFWGKFRKKGARDFSKSCSSFWQIFMISVFYNHLLMQ